MGKHFWVIYPHLDFIPSKSLFDLIYCDVWGPSWVPSILDFFCYIVFVDDFSRASWVYLFKDYTNVLPPIHRFLQEISTEYSKTPKILHSDALKFVKPAIHDLWISCGIPHQTTHPHTSQQNGVAKHKHRHLLNMTCTLRENGSPPFSMVRCLSYLYLSLEPLAVITS